ncbi:PPIC-type PPIASE domain-containing protein [Marinitoga hydrogenitolerans DSM 16785]|uniref:peptidylprolyl isomerase n=1 Tax=Marinitoga hydrogenitolerans (strain DSM 16785 / JCM 12826 / AT1271) TaxID=1122195 RepID=A0A1M4WK83_MARH1|nr:peptidylprolyl isomerase [Marinitoga hydrogenitolerans]SHE81615.1 PPIC-type PPIASE domain-containing protein [Marinitoga hydrogenitolerans DSM 16785]
MKKYLFLILVFLFTFISLGVIKYSDLDSKSVAIINKEIINYDYFQSQAKTLEILRGINKINDTFYKILVGTIDGNNVIQKYERTKLDRLAGEILFIQFTESKNIDLKKEELFNAIKSQTENIFNSSNLSENDILLYLISKGFENKEQYIYSLYHEKLYKNAVSAIYQYLINNIDVSDEEIKNEYNTNKDKYYKPQSSDLKLVFFKSSDDASLAYQKIIDGYYSFDDIYNNKYPSREATTIKINIDDQTNELIKTIKSSFPGAILKPMKYNNNYYSLIKIEKKTPKQPMTLDEAKDMIINNIKDEKAKQLFDKLISSEFQTFKNNSDIIINTKYFKGDESNGD